jgi:ubiquinone/menaquinone biosynthesis C-methylase UbiE
MIVWRGVGRNMKGFLMSKNGDKMGYYNTASLQANIRAHNRVAKKYERIHGEIYNEVEQNRLHRDLEGAIGLIQTESPTKKVMDFGCGAGNLTKHLSSLGVNVIAADISQGFLDLVRSREYNTSVETVRLNGIDLSNFPDESVDMIATYSVLHHVPDYLAILNEFMRVVKKGGVIYIDHETCDQMWQPNEIYQRFESDMRKKAKLDLSKYFLFSNYIDWIIRRLINPRFRREGDIHVFADDHIEWEKVKSTIIKNGGFVALEKDYLLFKRHFALEVYENYKDKVSDMRLLIAKKI